jgi:hypothetical protein
MRRSYFPRLGVIDDAETSMVIRYTLVIIAVVIAPLLGLLLLTHLQPDALLLDITPTATGD